jgi:SAM-dependent methyltransferase
VSGFSPEWLELREPFDAAARSPTIAAFLPHTLAERSVVDLGCGTGANLRYLAPRLGGAQEWLLVDDDRTVLAAAPGELAAWAAGSGSTCRSAAGEMLLDGAAFACRARLRALDLARDLDALPIAAGALVTSSALLDLVSATWLLALAARCRTAGAAVLFALTYDGRVSAEPADADDALVRELVNEHQHGDKGFGPALGPGGAAAAVRAFASVGYEVQTAASDWHLPPAARALQTALITGWHDAAAALAPRRAAALARWRQRRFEHVERGRSALTVGHVDLAARLP